ncbi:uncharacterized protein G2W53_045259 [Senna tora]|uniref:Uncharacterized protein n=1 Tax=Senna tora TaxID=362788 RepID=A0A834SCF4_9FABA|nr:uncharacterized protein G2W53_045259 [Senna tora]
MLRRGGFWIVEEGVGGLRFLGGREYRGRGVRFWWLGGSEAHGLVEREMGFTVLVEEGEWVRFGEGMKGGSRFGGGWVKGWVRFWGFTVAPVLVAEKGMERSMVWWGCYGGVAMEVEVVGKKKRG